MFPVSTADRIAALDETLLVLAEHWAETAAREWAIAKNLTMAHEHHREMGGDLIKSSSEGDRLRERIRAAERHKKLAEDQALEIRKQLLPPNRRGAGKKEPLAQEKRPLDPTTKALLERKRAKEAEKEKRRAERQEAREAAAVATETKCAGCRAIVPDLAAACPTCGCEDFVTTFRETNDVPTVREICE